MKMNMGSLDRTIRILVAIAIAVLFFSKIITGTVAIVLLAVASVFALTSFAGFCPLYLPLGLSTRKGTEKKREEILALIRDGAQVIDVRTKSEFASGHLKGSVNIPLDSLRNNLQQISSSKPVVVCCATGIRSRTASEILKSNGFHAIDGGSWAKLM